MRAHFVLAAAAIFLSAVGGRAAAPTTDEEAVRKAVYTEMEGAATHDIKKTMSVYAPGKEMVLYDAAPGVFVGYDAVRRAFENYFTQFPGLPDAKMDEITVRVSGDLAYAFSIQTWKMKRPDGAIFNTTQRVTNIFRKIGGKWLCVHEHASVPVDYFNNKDGAGK